MNRIQIILGCCGILLCSWLSSCAELTPVRATSRPSAQTATATATARQPAPSIDLAGRLSVRFQKDGRDEALHGSFTWAQRPDTTVISLLSPLGQTLAIISITPTVATIEQSGSMPRTAADPNALAAQTLGWPLPVVGLRHWLQGFVTDKQGNPQPVPIENTSAFPTGDGWSLQYSTWNTSDADHPHPKRIDLTRHTNEAGDVAIRLVIDEWHPI